MGPESDFRWSQRSEIVRLNASKAAEMSGPNPAMPSLIEGPSNATNVRRRFGMRGRRTAAGVRMQHAVVFHFARGLPCAAEIRPANGCYLRRFHRVPSPSAERSIVPLPFFK